MDMSQIVGLVLGYGMAAVAMLLIVRHMRNVMTAETPFEHVTSTSPEGRTPPIREAA